MQPDLAQVRRLPFERHELPKGRARPGIYNSPLTESCQRNFIVYLTDGLPTADNSAKPIRGLIGTCAGSGTAAASRNWRYMYVSDLRPPLRLRRRTYTIGFGPEVRLQPPPEHRGRCRRRFL
jgi:hypothetical protein